VPHETVSQNPVAPNFRLLLRALAEEIDSLAAPGERDDMLRGVGGRLARLLPVPAVGSLPALEIEINDVLAGIGWGRTQLDLNEGERSLLIIHCGLPRIGSLGAPPGTWLAALLEGLYSTWLAQQPGSMPGLAARLTSPGSADAITLRFSRA
jgi:hypothetical protein